uniref:BZIP domain-containing protein n=1 Tax=Acrobeloides nanus TaxID=290746 RepID=A0A914DU45_9BILA
MKSRQILRTHIVFGCWESLSLHSHHSTKGLPSIQRIRPSPSWVSSLPNLIMTSMPSSQQIIEYAPQKSEAISSFQPTTAYDTLYCSSPTFSYSAIKPTYSEMSNSEQFKGEPTVAGIYNAKLFEAPNREIKILMTPVYSNAPTSTMIVNEVPSTIATSSSRYPNTDLTQQSNRINAQQQPPTSFHTPISYVMVQQALPINDQANMNGSMETPGSSHHRLSNSDAESSVSSLPADLFSYSTRRIRDAQRKRRRRLTESVEEAALRRAKNLEAKRRRLGRETDDERLRRRQRDAEAKRRRRERESPEQRLRRLARDSERMRRNRRIKKLLRERGITDPNEITAVITQEKEHAKRCVSQPTPANIIIDDGEFKQEPITHMVMKTNASASSTLTTLPPNCNIIVVDQMPCMQQPTTSAYTQGPTIIRSAASSMVPSSVAQPVETKVEEILRSTPSSNPYDSSKDREERMRIRNRERARRRRANETPEQRAERNRRTAERMRRRRAELNQEKIPIDASTTPRELTEEEKRARFEEIFQAVLDRAEDDNLIRELEIKTEQARGLTAQRPNTREISTQTLVETKTYTILGPSSNAPTMHIEPQYDNAKREISLELHTLQPMSTQLLNSL